MDLGWNLFAFLQTGNTACLQLELNAQGLSFTASVSCIWKWFQVQS